jgi:hypothetical protein
MALRDLVSGMTGEDVRAIQIALNAWGAAPPLDTDGKFGSKTDAAVRKFQDAHHLKHDGIVGKDTRAALFPAVVVTVNVLGIRTEVPEFPHLRNRNRAPGSGLLSPGPYLNLDRSAEGRLGFEAARFPMLSQLLWVPVIPELTPSIPGKPPEPSGWVYDHLELQPGAQATFPSSGARQGLFLLTAQFVSIRGPASGYHLEGDIGVQVGIPPGSLNQPWTLNPYVQITDVDRLGHFGKFHAWGPYAQAGVQITAGDQLHPSLTGSLYLFNLSLDINDRLTLQAGGGWAFTWDLSTGSIVAGMQFASGLTLKLGTSN